MDNGHCNYMTNSAQLAELVKITLFDCNMTRFVLFMIRICIIPKGWHIFALDLLLFFCLVALLGQS